MPFLLRTFAERDTNKNTETDADTPASANHKRTLQGGSRI